MSQSCRSPHIVSPSALIAVLAVFLLAAPAGVASARVPRVQTLVKLLSPTTARTRPAGPRLERVAATQPLTGEQTVLPVIARRTVAGRLWLRVRLVGRKASESLVGWISATGTLPSSTPYRIVVSRHARRANLLRYGRTIRSFRVVVGKPSTPTPAGEFFVWQKVPQTRWSPLGPWALFTSAKGVASEIGVGLSVALHGRRGLLADPLGSARSHGCIRFSDASISYIAARVPAGTPVSIR